MQKKKKLLNIWNQKWKGKTGGNSSQTLGFGGFLSFFLNPNVLIYSCLQ